MQKVHSTNYTNTLIRPAEDCNAVAKVPDKAGSVVALQYEMMTQRPYTLTSDDVFATVAASRQGVSEDDLPAFRRDYFSKGQPCFRASPLTKTHGWAIHSDQDSRVALISPESDRFHQLLEDETVTKVMAMRNKRA